MFSHLESLLLISSFQVSVDFQLNSIYNVVEKSQSLNADFMLITTWTDPRLAIKTAPAMTLYGTDVFDKGLLWGPRLTFATRRDLTNPIDGVVRTYNTGKVQIVQRYLATYAMNFNMRDFPFDTQKLTWNIRSTTYDKNLLVFSPVTDVASLRNTSLLLQGLLDPTFSYNNYNQTTYTLTDGIFANYHLLSISIDARRIATMSSIFLVFPICLLNAALCLVFSQEPANNARLSVPLGVITSCLAFSYVVSNQCPPVSYTTRIHLMMFFSYVVAIICLMINYYLWAIEFAKRQLGMMNADKKNLLMDAHWMPRKILPPPTKVIVLPGGIHKQEDKKEAKNETLKADAVPISGEDKQRVDSGGEAANSDLPGLNPKADHTSLQGNLSKKGDSPRKEAWQIASDPGNLQDDSSSSSLGKFARLDTTGQSNVIKLPEIVRNTPLPGAVDVNDESITNADPAKTTSQKADQNSPNSGQNSCAMSKKISPDSQPLFEVKIQNDSSNPSSEKVLS